jgi:hypothetical protein
MMAVLSRSMMAVSFERRRANGFAGRPLEGALEAGERSCV